MIWRLRALGRGAARAAGGLVARPRRTAAVVALIAAALVVVGLAQLAARNVSAMTRTWRGAAMVVYLAPDTPPERAREIGGALAGLGGVDSVDYVTPQMALTRLRGALGQHGDALDGLEADVLPASIEITLGPGMRDVVAAHPVVARLRAAPGVDHVEIVGEWVDRASAALSLLDHTAWLALLILSLAGAGVVLLAARSHAPEHVVDREAAVLRLLGASRAFVHGPRALTGALLGVAGAIVGAAALWAVFAAAGGSVQAAVSAAFGPATLSFLAPDQLASLVAAAAGLGAAGTWASAARHAR